MTTNKTNTRAYNRYASRRRALRNRKLDTLGGDEPMFNNLHQYSKNKAKPFYSENEKTRNKGRRNNHPGNYSRSINYKPCDLRKVENMDEEEFEDTP